MGTVDGSSYLGVYDPRPSRPRDQTSWDDTQFDYGLPEICLFHSFVRYPRLMDVSADPSSELAAFLCVGQANNFAVKLAYPYGEDEGSFNHPRWEKAHQFEGHLNAILTANNHNLPHAVGVGMDSTEGKAVATILTDRIDDYTLNARTALSDWAKSECEAQGLTPTDVTFRPIEKESDFHGIWPTSTFPANRQSASRQEYQTYLDSLSGYTLGDVKGKMPKATVSGGPI